MDTVKISAWGATLQQTPEGIQEAVSIAVILLLTGGCLGGGFELISGRHETFQVVQQVVLSGGIFGYFGTAFYGITGGVSKRMIAPARVMLISMSAASLGLFIWARDDFSSDSHEMTIPASMIAAGTAMALVCSVYAKCCYKEAP